MKGSIEWRSPTSCRLVVSDGTDAAGHRVKYTKTLNDISEPQAQTLLARFLTEVKDGKKAKCGTMKLNDLFEFWIQNHGESNCEETTIYHNRSVFARAQKHLGGLRIDKITPRHLLDFYKAVQQPGVKKIKTKKDGSTTKPPQPLSPNTIKKMHGLLHAIFEKAVRWDLIPSNPADRVDPPRVPHKEKLIYNKKQIESFLQALEKEKVKHKLWVLLALTTTLRREEIFGLSWEDWPEVPGNLLIIQTCSVVAGKVVTKGTKNRTSNRIVSIPPTVIALLKEHRKDEIERKKLLDDKWEGSNRMITYSKVAHI